MHSAGPSPGWDSCHLGFGRGLVSCFVSSGLCLLRRFFLSWGFRRWLIDSWLLSRHLGDGGIFSRAADEECGARILSDKR